MRFGTVEGWKEGRVMIADYDRGALRPPPNKIGT
jgi:hypothetical protein